MSSANHSPKQVPAASRKYRFFRGLVRIGFTLYSRKIRLLKPETLPATGAAMLVMGPPTSFLDPLILVAVFERQLHCLVDHRLFRSPLRRFFAWGLNMIPCEPEGEGGQSALEACCDVLARRGAVVVFLEWQEMRAGKPLRLAPIAAAIALEAESCHSNQLGLTIFPVHLFLPGARSKASELLVYVDAPLFPLEYSASGGSGLPDPGGALANALEQTSRQNLFGLRPSELQEFLNDLEEVLRSDLEADWVTRPHWKQKIEGFELSRFVRGWAYQLNDLHPGQLVALRESLDAYREARRCGSLRRFEVEGAGPWLKTPVSRAWAWFETVAGLPIACYGLINHLMVWLIFFWAGFFKRESARDGAGEWLARALVVLGCYAGQILLCARLLGRPIAGYYALSLPLSGGFLWGYSWLLQHRSSLLILDLRVAREAERLRRMRKKLLEQFDAARNAYARTLGIPH